MRAAIAVALLGACASAPPPVAAPQPVAAPPATSEHPAMAGLQIKLASIYVDDQDNALKFYTDVLGFAKKDDFTNGPYRWLTVTAAGDGDGTQLQLALTHDPAAKAYQQALFAQHQPAANFVTDDLQAEYARIKARGGEFVMPPTDVTMSMIAQVKDGCGNLIQLTQLKR